MHVVMGLTVALTGLSGLAPGRARAAPTPGVLKVHVYDIGQGACVLVECPDDLPILIDCGKAGGGGGSIDTAGRKINAVLDGYDGPGGYLRPLRVILSHGDIDHYSLLKRKDERGKWLLNPERVRQVYYGGAFADYGDAQPWINAVHRTLSAPTKDYPPNRPCDDKAFRVSCLTPNETAWGSVRSVACGAARIDLLSANAQAYYRAHRTDFPAKAWKTDGKKNADSAVVRVSYEGVSFVFPGDAQELTEKLILANAEAAGQGLSGTGYLFGSHHGSDYDGSNHLDWIAALSPTHVVFSSNLGGGYGHPACAVVDRYDTKADASLTDASGAMPVRCGKAVQSQDFKNRFLVTEQTGDIEITVRAGQPPQMVCEKSSPGCL